MAFTTPDTAFDFGFSIVDEDEIESPRHKLVENISKAKAAQVEDQKKKIVTLYRMIMPLLENLKKDPDKEYILWPNRIEKIDAFIKKIDTLIKEEIEQ